MKEAILEWLGREDWQLREAVTLCGLLRMEEAVGPLLAIGALHAPTKDDWKADTITCGVIAVLGGIGDRRALLFLKAEAALCGEKEPKRSFIAILALSRIDLDEELRFLPYVVKGDTKYRGQRALETETDALCQIGNQATGASQLWCPRELSVGADV